MNVSPKFTRPKKFILVFRGVGFASPDPPFKSAAVAASASQVRTLKPSRPLSRPPGGKDLRGARPGTGPEAQDQARDWLGGPGPGQGLARRPWPSQAILFFFPRNKKKPGFFIFGGGSATPPPNRKKPDFFYSEGVKSQIGISGGARNADLGSDPL